MKITAYFDVIARPSADRPMHDAMSFIVQQAHHASRHGPVALGFPSMGNKPGLGDTVRVFGRDAETLNRVWDFLAENPRMDEYGVLRRPKPVPEKVERYEAYRRFRVSRPPSESRLKRLGERGRRYLEWNQAARDRAADKLNKTDRKGFNASGIAFATIYSASSRSQFRLFIERMADCPYSEGVPDGYGLSRCKMKKHSAADSGNLVALPVFGAQKKED